MTYFSKQNELLKTIASTFSLVCLLSFSPLQGVPETMYFRAGQLPNELSMYEGQDNLSVTILKGWPRESTITIWEEHAFKKKVKKGDIQLGSNDELAFVIGSKGYIPGMPVTYTFSDPLSKVTKQLTIIPSRLIATSNKDNATIEAKIISTFPPTYSITPIGFEKGERLKTQAISFEKSKKNLMTTDSFTKFAPDMQGKRGGIAKFIATRPSGEVLTLELPWGYEWIRYIGYTDTDGSVKLLIDNPENLKSDPEMEKYFYPSKT